MPEDLGWTGVPHWGWPDGEDSVFWVEGSVFEESGVLSHSVVKWDIVVLAPATEWMEKEDWVLVAQLDELFSSVLKEENVSIMERISNLEGVEGIGTLGSSSFLDLSWSESPLIHAIVEGDSLSEAHAFSGNEEVSLSHDDCGSWVSLREASKGTGADLFLSVIEEGWFFNDSEDVITKS